MKFIETFNSKKYNYKDLYEIPEDSCDTLECDILNGVLIEEDITTKMSSEGCIEDFKQIFDAHHWIEYNYIINQFRINDKTYVSLTTIPLNGFGESYGFNADKRVMYKIFLMTEDDIQIFETRDGFFNIYHDMLMN